MSAMVTTVAAPPGDVEVFVVDGEVVAIGFDTQGESLRARLQARFGALPFQAKKSDEATRVERYFTGELAALAALRLNPGGTEFQRRVWVELQEISAGTTRAYGEIARRLGDERAVRAVAQAVAQNPIALAIPCHRVIGSDGELTSYAGGLPRKEWLLAHEQRFTSARTVARGGGLPNLP